MSDNDPPANIRKFKPRPAELERRIRELAQNSSNVRWRSTTYETHTAARMDTRDITDRMMFDVLRTGYLTGEIEPGKNVGEWKVKMCKQLKGQREVGVVTIVINLQRLFVKTVEWEDVR